MTLDNGFQQHLASRAQGRKGPWHRSQGTFPYA